ncbi:hypothetical protein ACFX2C_005871 [Malus domestica]
MELGADTRSGVSWKLQATYSHVLTSKVLDSTVASMLMRSAPYGVERRSIRRKRGLLIVFQEYTSRTWRTTF